MPQPFFQDWLKNHWEKCLPEWIFSSTILAKRGFKTTKRIPENYFHFVLPLFRKCLRTLGLESFRTLGVKLLMWKVPALLNASIHFHFAPSAATFHFQLENGQVVELWLNALLANFENQKNENVGSVAITLGKEKPRFCDSNLLSFYFYWVSRRYSYLNLKLKKKKVNLGLGWVNEC